METKTPPGPPAPEYSQLPEVSASFGTDAPEAVEMGLDSAKAVTGPYLTLDSNWIPPQYPKPPVQASRSPFPIPTSAYADSPAHGYSTRSTMGDGEGSRQKTVLILSILVGVLAAAVVGLATATGLMAKRANDAETANLSQNAVDGTFSTVTTTATTTTTATVIAVSGTASPVPIIDLSNGCGDKNEKISGTTYTTQIFGKVSYVRYCNAQLKQFPIYGMLTLDFEACMDACAAWSSKGREILGKDNPNAICGGVRFVPAWTNRTLAWATNARGNCFLHKSPQTVDDLQDPDLKDKVPCHAAILVEKR
ncbi:hypothetical protein F5144DRAFT_87683 [Chaetomium tenue]|uniref:Uncharacterized protein n=1 Tax=Chaetomium tenue TaxID=1854479 RepID=A0ACB7PGJ6_9PEZI|nr:hypothetical protein F5144DRAFT_87683 [Chaetomium globosum]